MNKQETVRAMVAKLQGKRYIPPRGLFNEYVRIPLGIYETSKAYEIAKEIKAYYKRCRIVAPRFQMMGRGNRKLGNSTYLSPKVAGRVAVYMIFDPVKYKIEVQEDNNKSIARLI